MSKSAPVIKASADWSVRTVGEITTLLRRGTAPTYVEESDVKAIGQRCVKDSGFDGSFARPHSSRAMDNVVTPEVGDVLINSTGTGTIGRSAIFPKESPRYIVDSHVTVARPRQADLAGQWLDDVLRSPAGQRYLEAKCYAGSTNQVELSTSSLILMPIALPAVEEQHRVARVLAALDDQIAVTTKLVQKLESCHRGLLLDSFAHAGDELMALGDLVDKDRPIVYGILMPGDHVPSGVPVIKVKNMRGGAVDREDLLRTSPEIDREYRRSRLRRGDVLLSIRGTVGRVCVIPPELDGANITQDSARIAVTQELSAYVAHYLDSPSAQRFINSETVGLAVRGINLRDVRRIQIPIVSRRRVNAVCNALDGSRAKINREVARLAKLSRLKRGLADDLLTGRVRVPEGLSA